MNARTLISTAALAMLAFNAHATDLLQVWQAARQHDPQGTLVEASRAAGTSRHEQGAALWRPQVGLTASAGHASANSQMNGAQFAAPPNFPATSGVAFATSVQGGTATRWVLSARQPLYNAERSAQQKQLDLGADAANIEGQNAQQEWMLHTTQRYFDVVLAEQRLALLQAQQTAVEKALTEAKDRFAIGDAPVTDTHEATARARALQAQRVAASNDLEMARTVLGDITGLSPAELQLLRPAENNTAPNIEPLAHWLELARQNNPMIRLQQAQTEVAAQEVRKHRLSGSASLDLVAQASRDRISGSGDFGSASNTQNQQMVGLSLNVPLYTGGWRSAKLEEALHLQDKAQAELDRTRLQAGQMTRAAWLAVQSGHTRLQALTQAHQASLARLDATRLGKQVGDRTTLDLLNAENDASAAALNLLQARTDVLLNQLRLHALVGQLDTEKLQAVNAALQP